MSGIRLIGGVRATLRLVGDMLLRVMHGCKDKHSFTIVRLIVHSEGRAFFINDIEAEGDRLCGGFGWGRVSAQVFEIAVWDKCCIFHPATADHFGLGSHVDWRCMMMGEKPFLDPASTGRKAATGGWPYKPKAERLSI